MSDEGRRDVKAMLAMLESDGPFDHTEGWLSWFATGRDPDGTWGTDIFGTVWKSKLERIATLEMELEKEREEKETLQRDLTALKEEIEGHQGTISTLTNDNMMLKRKLIEQFKSLQRSSVVAFRTFQDAYHTFIDGIERDVNELEK
jgi:hypothetical protein